MSKNEKLSFRLDSKTKDYLQEEAENQHLSISNLLYIIILQYKTQNQNNQSKIQNNHISKICFQENKENVYIPNSFEVENYFTEKAHPKLEAKIFYNYYQARDWYSGKAKIKNWKAQADLWILNKIKEEQALQEEEKERKLNFTAEDFEKEKNSKEIKENYGNVML